MLHNIKERYQEVSATVKNTVTREGHSDSEDDKVTSGNDNNNSKSEAGEGKGQDLNSILDRSQRGDLMMLVIAITEAMRGGVEKGFDYQPPVHPNSDDTGNDSNGKVFGLTQDEAEIERPPALPTRPGSRPHPPRPSSLSRSVSKSSLEKEEVLDEKITVAAGGGGGGDGGGDGGGAGGGAESESIGVKTGTLVELEPQSEPEAVPEYRPRLPARPRPGSVTSSSGKRPLAENLALRTERGASGPAVGPNKSSAAISALKSRDKNAALSHFSDWADSVILRIGNVLNSDEERGEQKDELDQDSEGDNSSSSSSSSRNSLHAIYPPVETPLVHLSRAKRLLTLHSLLLLLLSLQHYNAYSRVFMLRFTSSLNLHIKDLNQDESKVARGLLDAVALASSSSSSNADGQPQKKTDTARIIKVGIASVAGAALIGVTGGLAAPLVAAGLGSVLGGLGLGATAAATYLGALAGSGVVVGGLFGAYGGRMTGKMMDKYAREVEDFAFLPIHGREEQRSGGDSDRRRSSNNNLSNIRRRLPPLPWKPTAESEEAQQDHRLRVTIGITGWVTEGENDFTVPWRVIGNDTEKFGLRWELESLLKLGNAISALVTSAAWGMAGREVLSRTIFAGIMSAVTLPLGLMKVSRVVDNPFSVAKARADKAGRVLADVLINKAQGERPVTLVGYSLGSRVIYSCLQTLAKRRAYGLVESAVMMGSPIPSDLEVWRAMRSVVVGRLVNVFSENDAVLAFLYRTSSLQLGIAGLQPIAGAPGLGVQNVNVSDLISGHLRYQYLLGKILARIGLVVDIDVREAALEEALLTMRDREQEEELNTNEQRAAADDDDEFVDARAKEARTSANGSSEEKRLQTLVERRTQERLMRRRMEQRRLRRTDWDDDYDDDD